MSKRRRYLSESESESEPAAEEANGGESEEADEPYSTIWRAAGPLTMRHDMQHDSQVLYSLRTGDLVKQTKPAVTARTTGRKYVHVSTVVAATGQEVLGWVTSLLGTEFPSAPAGLQEIPEAEQEEAVGRYQAARSTPVSTTVAPGQKYYILRSRKTYNLGTCMVPEKKIARPKIKHYFVSPGRFRIVPQGYSYKTEKYRLHIPVLF